MNNEQNNILAGLNSNIEPVPVNNNQNLANSFQNNSNNNTTDVIPGANLTPIINNPTVNENQAFNTIKSQPEEVINEQPNAIINPTPIPGMEVTNEVTSITNSNQANNNQNTIIPNQNPSNSVNNNANNTIGLNSSNLSNQSQLTTSSQPDIKLETTTPFDIGINSVNTNQAATQMMMSENIKNITNGMEENKNLSSEVTSTNQPLTNSNITNDMNNSNDNIVSVGSYLGHILLFSIPLIGFVMLLVKAFGSKSNKNISNFAKAQLLLSVIVVVLSMVIMFAITFIIGGSMI